MGLFDSVRDALGGGDGGDPEPELTDDVPRPANHGEPTPTDFRNKAVDAIQDWDADLDFSLDSLPRLDAFADRQGAVLDVMAADHDDEASVAGMHTAYTIRAGSYYGELLVRAAGGQWVREGEVWAVQVPTGDGEASLVDVFEVAAHSFAEAPVFVEMTERLGVDVTDEDDDADDAGEPDDVRPEMRAEAADVAAFWDGYDLDFSPASLERLDTLVEREFDPDEFFDVDPAGEDMEAKMYRQRVKQLGSYFGEVVVRHLDGDWARRDGAVVVDVPAGRDGWVTLPVFDAAGEGLRGAPRFVLEYNDCIADAGLDATPVDPDEPSADADHGDATLDADPPVADENGPAGGGDDGADGTATGGEPTGATADAAPVEGTGSRTDPGADDGQADDERATGPDVPSVDPGESTAADASAAAGSTDEERIDDAVADPDVGADGTLDLGEGDGDDDAVTVADLTDDASAFAATWPGYDLDFSPGSLERLDALVRDEYDTDDAPAVSLDGSGVGDSYLTARIVETGGYLAEVLRRSVGGEWRETGGGGLAFVVTSPRGETELDPVAVASDCFRGEESFVAAYADVRDAVSG